MVARPQIQIYQIYYLAEQIASLDPAFIPYDNTSNRFPKLMEYAVFIENYDAGRVSDSGADLIGYVSWKFGAKTGLTGAKFIDFVCASPPSDVYFINPYPEALTYRNVWYQGEDYHPGLVDFTQSILDKLNYTIDLIKIENNIDSTALCNYWIASPRFWDAYIAFTRPVFNYLVRDATPDEQAFLWSKADRDSGHSFFPYILERMFPTFLAIRTDFTRTYYRYSSYELRLRHMPPHIRLFLRTTALNGQFSIRLARLMRGCFTMARNIKRPHRVW